MHKMCVSYACAHAYRPRKYSSLYYSDGPHHLALQCFPGGALEGEFSFLVWIGVDQASAVWDVSFRS